jgi:hypothetical protein
MTIRRKPLLIELLQAIVREWGTEAVFVALNELRVDGNPSSQTAKNALPSEKGKRSLKKKPSAVQLVAKISQPSNRRELLMMIATKYDAKRFLPSVSDVREFLVMRGERRRPIKDRSEGFRLFLETAKELPFQQLEHLATDSVFSGPSELAPLSDAIGATGEARRQQTMAPKPADTANLPDDSQASDDQEPKLD